VTANRIACRARDHRRKTTNLVAHGQIDRHGVVAADPDRQVAEVLARDEADEA
jgi:hypothetical protein